MANEELGLFCTIHEQSIQGERNYSWSAKHISSRGGSRKTEAWPDLRLHWCLWAMGHLFFLLSARSVRRAKRQISMSSSYPCHTAAFTKLALLEWFVCSARAAPELMRFSLPTEPAHGYQIQSRVNPCCFLINHGWRLTVKFKTSVGLSHMHHSTFTLPFLSARRHTVRAPTSNALLLAPFSLENHLSFLRSTNVSVTKRQGFEEIAGCQRVMSLSPYGRVCSCKRGPSESSAASPHQADPTPCGTSQCAATKGGAQRGL